MTEEDIRINQITEEDIKIITKEEYLNEEGTDKKNSRYDKKKISAETIMEIKEKLLNCESNM